MVQVTKANISTTIWESFYDLISANAASVVNGSTTVTADTITNSYSEKMLDEKSNYPIIVIGEPSTPTDTFTMGKSKVEGTIDIDVFTTSGKVGRLFKDKIQNAIETNKGTLAGYGLHLIEVEDTDYDHFTRNSFNVHNFTITFSFTYRYTRTAAY